MNNINTSTQIHYSPQPANLAIVLTDEEIVDMLEAKLNAWLDDGGVPENYENRKEAGQIIFTACLYKFDTILLENLQLTTLPDVFDNDIFKNHLTSFSCSNNRLTELPKSLEKLPNITELNIGSNPFQTVPPVVLKIPKLDGLTLDNIQLAEIPEELGHLTTLNALDLSKNPITDLPASLQYLVNLRALDLSDTLVEELPLWHKKWAKLEFLNFQME